MSDFLWVSSSIEMDGLPSLITYLILRISCYDICCLRYIYCRLLTILCYMTITYVIHDTYIIHTSSTTTTVLYPSHSPLSHISVLGCANLGQDISGTRKEVGVNDQLLSCQRVVPLEKYDK